jgi:hypothetical protein
MDNDHLYLICKDCNERKLKKDFYKNSKKKSGREGRCKACKKSLYDPEVAKEKYFFKKYNLNKDTYIKLMNSECEICSSKNNLVIDHNHDTGAFRGCLCHNCNTAIGQFKDSKRLLENAIKYIEEKGTYDRSNF